MNLRALAGEIIITDRELPTIFLQRAVPNLVIDIGGEGRHAEAWKLNLSPIKTLGPDRGSPIPRLILGRAEAIPLPNQCASVIFMERTPLRVEALREIRRVIRDDGTIILRHSIPPTLEPHRTACRFLPGRAFRRWFQVSGRWMQETVFQPRLAQSSLFQTSTGRLPVE